MLPRRSGRVVGCANEINGFQFGVASSLKFISRAIVGRKRGLGNFN